MVRKIAVYGKGGIGKSTVSSNLTAALVDRGVRVLQVGCDPKHDSTRALIGGTVQNTVLDYLKTTSPEERRLEDIVAAGYGGCLCVEAGGPEPGVGCAGRGIISAFDLLENLGSETIEVDITLYDVLGDVVCGGFAVPIRDKYADTVYIVTSGEFMSIYAANNILKGVRNYDPDRIGGLIFNSRGDPDEDDRVERFSEAVGIPIVARFGRSKAFMEAERQGKTVVQMSPDSDIADAFRELAGKVLEGRRYTAESLEEGELERLILGRESKKADTGVRLPEVVEATKTRRLPYTSRNVEFDQPLNGCAFSGASSVCTSVEGLTVILHSPRSCAHFTVQLDTNSVLGSLRRGYETVRTFGNPDVVCTDMDEQSMIFGGMEGLGGTLEYEYSLGKRNLAVITACPPGIIGDDVTSVTASFEKRHKDAKVAVLAEDGNATGDFMQGVIDAGIGLVERFSAPGPTIRDSLDLVGTKTMSSSAMRELRIVKDILDRLGITVNCVLPGITSIDGLEKARKASASLMLNTDAFTESICRFMESECSVPTLPVPVRGGVEGTCEWIDCVAGFFHKRREAESIKKGIREGFSSMMAGPREILEGRTCVVVTVFRDTSWVTETIEAAGMKAERIYVFSRADYGNTRRDEIPDGTIIVDYEHTAEALEEIGRLCPDIVASEAVADIDPSIYQSRLPTAPAADPYAGVWLAEDWARGMSAPAREGWRDDVAR